MAEELKPDTKIEPKVDPPKVEDKPVDKTKEIETPEGWRQHVSELRDENKRRRLNEEALAKKIAELEKADEARKRKDLEEEKRYREIAEGEVKKREESEAKSADAIKKAERRYIVAELKAQAVSLGIIDPDDVKSIDISDLRVDDDGVVVGGKDAIESLKTKKPHWFKTEKTEPEKPVGQKVPVSGGGAKPGPKDAFSMSPEEFSKEMARLTGP